MYMHLNKKLFRNFFAVFLLILLQCSYLFSPEDEDILKQFDIIPLDYYGIDLRGIVVFNEPVTKLEWSSASGEVVFDEKSNADSILQDTIKIYYSRIPMLKIIESHKDSLGNESFDTLITVRSKDTIYLRFLYNNEFRTYTKVINLKNFRPFIDSFSVKNGNLIKYNNKYFASFLIGSGVAKIFTYCRDMQNDSVRVYWSSKRGILAPKELKSYLPLEFKIPENEVSDTLYARVINSYGAFTVDSVIVNVYKERGSIWVLDEKGDIFKFSSTGKIIDIIDSLNIKEIAFYAPQNRLFVINSEDSLEVFYTNGKRVLIDRSQLVGYRGESHLYKLNGDIYLSIYAIGKTSIFQYVNNGFVPRFSYNNKLLLLSKSYDYYFGAYQRADSSYIAVFKGDSLLNRKLSFLGVKDLETDDNLNRLYILDDQTKRIYAYNYLKDTLEFFIYGFTKPVDMAIDKKTSKLFVIDGSSSLAVLDVKSISSNYNVSNLLKTNLISLDKPVEIIINNFNDGESDGCFWIADKHNNRVVKLNLSGLYLRSIEGFFYFPIHLTVNEGI